MPPHSASASTDAALAAHASDPSEDMRALGARLLTSLVAALGALIVAVALAELHFGDRPQFALDRLALGAVFMAAAVMAWLLRARSNGAALVTLLVALMLGIAFNAWRMGLGVHMLAVASCALLVAVAGPTLGLRAALGMLALHLAVIGTLAWGHWSGMLDGQTAEESMSLATRVVGHALVAVAGLCTAVLLARLVSAAFTRAAGEHGRVADLLELGSDWTWELDARTQLVALSPSFELNSGYRRAQFARLNQPGGPRVVEDENWRAMQQLFRERQRFREHRLTYIGPDGKPMHTLFSGAPVFDAKGRLTGWRGVGRNVTAEYEARLAQERSEALLNRLFESSPDAICVGRASDGRILLANAGFLELTGLAQADVLGRSVAELGLWPDMAEPWRIFRAMRAGGGTVRDVRTTVQLRGGEQREVLVTAAGFQAEGTTLAVVTLRDITDVERAKQQAEAASQAKSAFLATMSHEIRTPLNGVLGLARLLQEPGLDGSLRAEYLAHLADSAQLLSGLVSDVLDLSKIESGRMQVESIVFDLHELVQGTFSAFATLGQERGLAMACQLDAGVPCHVRGDPVRVRQILANYLSNAVKFTERGRITVAVHARAGGRVRLEVHDSGPGVAPELQRRVFEPFLQADSSTTRRFGGTGLGLSICKQLAQLMGGEVGVLSAHAGELEKQVAAAAAAAGAGAAAGPGSTFWMELPLPAVPPPAAVPAPFAAASAGAPSALEPLQGISVLVAEDNPVNMLIVSTMLQRLGARVLEAVDGDAALLMAREHARELGAVLMDLHMPGQDGLAATRALRAEPATAALPIYAFSAAVLEHERHEAAAAGMNGFIAKPVEQSDLVRALAPLASRPTAPATA